MIRISIISVFILFFLPGIAQQVDLSDKDGIMIIHDCDKPRSEKEALLVLSGFGDSRKGRRHQKAFFDTVGYDMYLPFYLDNKSVSASYDKFITFHKKKKLHEYKTLHVFSYILGSWIINTYINENGAGNIKTIVYDRSPLQEQAPRMVVEKVPLLARMLVGPVVKDFSNIPYPSIEKGDIKIGIIVESRATFLVRRFKKTIQGYGEIDWENPPIKQEYDDLIYTMLNHDEMYEKFEVIGDEIMHFIRHGKFPEDARRTLDFENHNPYEKQKGMKRRDYNATF